MTKYGGRKKKPKEILNDLTAAIDAGTLKKPQGYDEVRKEIEYRKGKTTADNAEKLRQEKENAEAAANAKKADERTVKDLPTIVQLLQSIATAFGVENNSKSNSNTVVNGGSPVSRSNPASVMTMD